MMRSPIGCGKADLTERGKKMLFNQIHIFANTLNLQLLQYQQDVQEIIN